MDLDLEEVIAVINDALKEIPDEELQNICRIFRGKFLVDLFCTKVCSLVG